MAERQQRLDPEKVTEDDVGDPEWMVGAIVRKVLHENVKPADQLAALNRHLDAFSKQYFQSERTGPGPAFVERAMSLLQVEIEKRDLQGRMT